MIQRIEFNWFADKDGEHFMFYEVGSKGVASIEIISQYALIIKDDGSKHIVTNLNSIFYAPKDK